MIKVICDYCGRQQVLLNKDLPKLIEGFLVHGDILLCPDCSDKNIGETKKIISLKTIVKTYNN